MRTRAPDQALAPGRPLGFTTAFGGLGWVWACATSAYLLAASNGEGLWSSSMFVGSEVDVGHLMPSLTAATGVWITALLAGLTVVAGIPLGVALTHPPDQRRTALASALLLLAFALLARPSLGLPYLPSATLLVAAALMGDLEVAPASGRNRS